MMSAVSWDFFFFKPYYERSPVTLKTLGSVETGQPADSGLDEGEHDVIF